MHVISLLVVDENNIVSYGLPGLFVYCCQLSGV